MQFKSDYGSVIQLADVPYPQVCEIYEKRSEHGLWEGANVGAWIEVILNNNNISFKKKKKVKSPEGWFYYVLEIDGVDHWYSIAKKDGKIWVVAEKVSI